MTEKALPARASLCYTGSQENTLTHPLKLYPFPKSQLDFWLTVADESPTDDGKQQDIAEAIPHPFYRDGIYKHPYADDAWNERTYEVLANRLLLGDPHEPLGDIDGYATLLPNRISSPVSAATQMLPPASFVVRLALTRQRNTFVTLEEAEEVTSDANSFIETLWLSGKPREEFNSRATINAGEGALVALTTVYGFTEEDWNAIFEWVSEDNDWDVMLDERQALASNPNLPPYIKDRFIQLFDESFGEMGDDEFDDELRYSAYNILPHLRTLTAEDAEDEATRLVEAFRPRFKDGKIDEFGSNSFIKEVLTQFTLNPAIPAETGIELGRLLSQRCLYVSFDGIMPSWSAHPVTYAAWSTVVIDGDKNSPTLFSETESVWLTDEQAEKLARIKTLPLLAGHDQYDTAPSKQTWCRPGYPCAVQEEYLNTVGELLEENGLKSLFTPSKVVAKGQRVLPATQKMVGAIMACACGTPGVEELRNRLAAQLVKTVASDDPTVAVSDLGAGVAWLPYLGKCFADLEAQLGEDVAENIPLSWLVELV